jgi:hypothetical protein
VTGSTAWPEAFRPDTAPVFTHNEVRSALPAEVLWPILVRAADWPRWYPHATDVRTADGKPDLGPASVFGWKTLGVRVTTTVTEFEPLRTLAWSGTGPGSRGYHRWVFTPTADEGCLIVTEEVQVGLVPRLLAPRLRRNLREYHQVWLEELVARGAGKTGS